DRVARLAGRARPLRIEMRLRPQLVLADRDEPLRQEFRGVEPGLAVDRFDVRRTAAPDLVHHVDRIAELGEILRPAVASVRRAYEVGPAHGAAGDHDQWKRVLSLLRNEVFDVDLAGHNLAARRIEILAADEEV